MENTLNISIGKRIAHIRHKNNMTQEVLANHLNVSPKHISHVERGTSNLSLKNLIELCHFLNCSLDYLILGKNQNDTLSKLPEEIVTILSTGSDKEITRLNQYLQMYLDIKNQD